MNNYLSSPSSISDSLSSSLSSLSSTFSSSSSDSSWMDKGKDAFSQVTSILQGNSFLEKIVFVLLVFFGFMLFMSIGSHILTALLQPSNPFVVDGLLTATNGKVIPQDPAASGSVPIGRSDNEDYGIEFSWSIWVNITNLDDQYDQYKHIFSKGDNNNVEPVDGKNSPNNSPGLYIKPSSNTLIVFMNTFETIDEEVEVSNVPLNKWLHVLIRVEGTFLDVYVNGILAKRHVLPSVPKQNNGSVYVAQNGGFNGFISNLRYYERALDPGEIMSIVNGGPSLKLSKLETSDLKSSPNYLSLDWYFQNSK